MRRLSLMLAAGLAGAVLSGEARGVAGQQDALVKLLVPPMTTVTKLTVFEIWNPRFDDLVLRFPAAAPLGAKWNTEAPAWQKARSAVGSRLSRIVEAYATSGEVSRHLRTALAAELAGDRGEALLRALTGPDGPAILHYEGMSHFLLEVRSATPNAAQPGDPSWSKEIGALVRKFRDATSESLPRDQKREEAAQKFSDEPLGRQFSGVWMTVISKGALAIDGAINLMVFDDREAIARDITQAIATVK